MIHFIIMDSLFIVCVYFISVVDYLITTKKTKYSTVAAFLNKCYNINDSNNLFNKKHIHKDSQRNILTL